MNESKFCYVVVVTMTTETVEQPGKESGDAEVTEAKANMAVEVKDGSDSDTESGDEGPPELEDPAHAAVQSQVSSRRSSGFFYRQINDYRGVLGVIDLANNCFMSITLRLLKQQDYQKNW